MKNPIDNFWKLKLESVKESLESNNFEVFIADNSEDASKIVLENIIPAIDIKSISWGGSMTFVGTGLYDTLKEQKGFKVLDTFDKSVALLKIMLYKISPVLLLQSIPILLFITTFI